MNWNLTVRHVLQSANKNQISVPKHGTNSSLLDKICDLIKKFPEYFDVVVSVARKTDGQHWADLFSAAGRSTMAALDESLYELDGKLSTGGNLLTREASNGHTAGSVRCGISFGSYVLCQVQRANSHPSHSFKTIRGSF
ncbi:unnamed protein product [Camellia sinensis]